MLEADILNTRWNKDRVCDTYHSDYFERKVSVMFVAIRLIIQMVTNAHLIIELTAQYDTSNFPR